MTRSVLVLLSLSAFVFSARRVAAQLQAPPGYNEKMRDQQYVFNGMPEGEWVNRPAPGTLPLGVEHHTYHSRAMGHDVGYAIYLPPQYATEPERRFPVIYHLHGISGSEISTLRNAVALHEGIVAGKWPPMILVFPSGRQRTFYSDWEGSNDLAEKTVIRELIPTIDATYRTIAAGYGRCIEGHSMGGRGATLLALKYPELFCSLFNQAGNVVRIAALYDSSRRDKFPYVMLGGDRARYSANDPFELLHKNLDLIRGKMRILIMCGTADTTHLPSVREFHQALVEVAVDHTYIEVDQDYEAFRTGKKIHDQARLLGQFKAIWFDYHVESLRRAAEAAKKPGTDHVRTSTSAHRKTP